MEGHQQPIDPGSFSIEHEAPPSPTLICGFSAFGLAGLVAADFLVKQLALEETGHIVTDALAPFTPFEDGVPRHHSRLFSTPESAVSVLVNDLFVPPWATDPFATAILEWGDENAVEEVTVLVGAPFAHTEDQHVVSYIATEDYREHRLAGSDLPPMRTGYLEGINASLVSRGIDSTLRVGLLVTPVHAQPPDVDAAIRLVEVVSDLYGFDVDAGPLDSFATAVEQHYQDLGRKVAEEPGSAPEDRMYM
ncbi:proteasome assembly chaperone family protein [Haloarchaeobius amylolyticus]|uniref:proteasome assembly chaperone family protein n=1 Tax=Haloarchaeobius amylolyticus TaxID=1198296 RepID=UPI00226ED495|nr:PAC2 family protein [Haloarchaeobius amylolyticus]